MARMGKSCQVCGRHWGPSETYHWLKLLKLVLKPCWQSANLCYKVSKAVLRWQKKKKKRKESAVPPWPLSHGTALLHVGLCISSIPSRLWSWNGASPSNRAPKPGENPPIWGPLGSVGAQGYMGLAQGHSEMSPGATSGSSPLWQSCWLAVNTTQGAFLLSNHSSPIKQ